MRIILHEIELGTTNPDANKAFYHTLLGLPLTVDHDQLKVFQPNIEGMDFNLSTHIPQNAIIVSFLTNNLQAVINHLNQQQKPFIGPKDSHLGMTFIQLEDPNGNTVKINMPTDASPQWLKDRAAAIN